MSPKAWRRLFLILFGVPAAMIASFVLVLSLLDGDWKPVEAKVLSAEIVSTRSGSLTWSILVDAAYEVDGARYERQRLDVFHDVEYDVSEARLADWSEGKRFTLYVDPADPQSSSLAADGGREALAVVAAMLTPMLIALVTFIVLIARRARAARLDAAQP